MGERPESIRFRTLEICTGPQAHERSQRASRQATAIAAGGMRLAGIIAFALSSRRQPAE